MVDQNIIIVKLSGRSYFLFILSRGICTGGYYYKLLLIIYYYIYNHIYIFILVRYINVHTRFFTVLFNTNFKMEGKSKN